MSATDPTYALGRSNAEHRRLAKQAELLRPLTERLFRAAGIGPGMRVLDVGSGVGDVALLVASLVGPEGEVIGIDLDAGALDVARARAEAHGLANLSFIHGDIRSAELPQAFDAAVGRLVLMYFADPVEGLRAIAARVKSGGPIAFQEMIMDTAVAALTSSHPADSLWASTANVIIRTFEAAGVHGKMGRDLLQTYQGAGLPVPSMLVESFAGGGPDFAGYAWLANTLRSLAPIAEKFGVATAATLELDTLAEQIRDEAIVRGLFFMSPPYVGAFATKP